MEINFCTKNGHDFKVTWNKKVAIVTCSYEEEIGNLDEPDIDYILETALILGIEKVILRTDCGVNIHSHTLRNNKKYSNLTLEKFTMADW